MRHISLLKMSPRNILYSRQLLLVLEVFSLPPAEGRSRAPRVRPSSLTTHIVSLCCSTGNSTSLSHARCHLVALGWHVILWQSLSCREESPSGQGCRSSLLHLTCCFPCSTGNSLSCYFILNGAIFRYFLTFCFQPKYNCSFSSTDSSPGSLIMISPSRSLM